MPTVGVASLNQSASVCWIGFEERMSGTRKDRSEGRCGRNRIGWFDARGVSVRRNVARWVGGKGTRDYVNVSGVFQLISSQVSRM